MKDYKSAFFLKRKEVTRYPTVKLALCQIAIASLMAMSLLHVGFGDIFRAVF